MPFGTNLVLLSFEQFYAQHYSIIRIWPNFGHIFAIFPTIVNWTNLKKNSTLNHNILGHVFKCHIWPKYFSYFFIKIVQKMEQLFSTKNSSRTKIL